MASVHACLASLRVCVGVDGRVTQLLCGAFCCAAYVIQVQEALLNAHRRQPKNYVRENAKQLRDMARERRSRASTSGASTSMGSFAVTATATATGGTGRVLLHPVCCCLCPWTQVVFVVIAVVLCVPFSFPALPPPRDTVWLSAISSQTATGTTHCQLHSVQTLAVEPPFLARLSSTSSSPNNECTLALLHLLSFSSTQRTTVGLAFFLSPVRFLFLILMHAGISPSASSLFPLCCPPHLLS